jgi:ABC-type nitrate/sulfonate/bicarbonate transport system permease component
MRVGQILIAGSPERTSQTRSVSTRMARKPLSSRRSVRFAVQISVLLLLLVAWQFYSTTVSPIILPGLPAVWNAGKEIAISGELWAATLASLEVFAIGFGLAIIVGVVLGIAVGRSRWFSAGTEHILTVVYVTPQIALLPIIIVWFGLGLEAKVVLVFLVSMFPIMFNARDGVAQISAHHVEVARSYGASEAAVLREVMIPSIAPYVMTGIRQGAGRGLTGMVVGEMFTGISGLGGIIVAAGNTLQTAKAFAPIFVLAAIGLVVIEGGKWLETHVFVRWKNTERAF